MEWNESEFVVVGAGAAGIAAAHRLVTAGFPCIVLEARPRLGGRAWTAQHGEWPLDLGCGWFHSADRNPWVAIAQAQGRTIDKTPPPWARRSVPIGFPLAEQDAYLQALASFHQRLAARPSAVPDCPAAQFLEQGGRWNALIDAVSTYVSGAELTRVSACDLAGYDDSGVNWRAVEGYGSVIAAHAATLPVVLDCPVHGIDHSGQRLVVLTAHGAITAKALIVAVPSAILAEEAIVFTPALLDKIDAAVSLPLGLADKLFLSLSGAEEFAPESRVFGRTDCAATATYHFRPFGRPMIEAYFAGSLAAELERGGVQAFVDFARTELARLLGTAFPRRIELIALHCWRADPFARGSYSYAVPGKAGSRAVLAAPVEERIFFAGEACSPHDYSTAHGAYLTGIAAAERAIAARGRS
ncbi:MAG: flavin monoamine oxidase family protein [Xanthobacteraceae bacterium]